MKLSGKELEIRNQYIIMLNENEFRLKNSLTRCKKSINLEIPNIITHIKNKNFELETYFYDKNIKYYSESAVGILIFLYFEIIEEKATRELIKILEFENYILTMSYFKIKLKNPYLKRYLSLIEEINKLTLDENLFDKLYNVGAKKEIKALEPYIENELTRLKSPEYSQTCIKKLNKKLSKSPLFINN